MRTLGMPMLGGLGRIQKDVVYLDAIFYVLVIFLGAVPIFFIGTLSQNNAILVGKVNLIVGMGALGILMIHSLFAVKQVKIVTRALREYSDAWEKLSAEALENFEKHFR